MKRILSGIRANSDLTLGNYLGALKPWVELQSQGNDNDLEIEYFFFIPNLHSIMGRLDPATLRRNTLSNVAWYLASGLDPDRVTLYVQSQVSAHAELAWIFQNYTTMGELNRMTQYKDKARKGGSEGELVGLFTYPTLMAADILLYDADEVPVGDDQRQHVELARDIAQRFNNLYGEMFRLPVATSPVAGARIMNLQNPRSKMSKSDNDASGTIMLTDGADPMRQKIKRAVMDSESGIDAKTDSPGVLNVLQILAALETKSLRQVAEEHNGQGYGQFKDEVADRLVAHLEPIRARHDELMNDESQLLAILDDGREKATAMAEEKLAQVKQALGLL